MRERKPLGGRGVKEREPAKPTGRPSKFSEAIADEILDRISNGEPLTRICLDAHMPSVSTVFNWERIVEGFSEKVTRAREFSADHYSHEIIEIAEEMPLATTSGEGWERSSVDPAGVQRNKLRIDTRIKLMQMLKRKTYGDKIDVSGNLKVTRIVVHDDAPAAIVIPLPKPEFDDDAA